MDALNVVPYPSCHNRFKIGVLMTTHICGPALFPCLILATGVAHISVPTHN